MAHFAKLGNNNIVLSVESVNNNVIMKNGKEDEATGVKFLQMLHGSNDVYKQTSYSGSFRKQFAGIGYTYDSDKDKFIKPQPFPSWTLNNNDDWEAPVDYPSDASEEKFYYWDENNQNWKAGKV